MAKMRAGIRSLWQEEKGVSVVIGAMLMLLVVAAMWGTIQAFLVPDWNKDVEYEHLNIVHDDMITFKSDVEDVALSGAPKSSDFQMGVRYPNRMFLANPGTGVAGSLTSDNVAVSIEYTIDAPGDPVITQTYNSNRVTYEVQGTIDRPRLVYEHGVIIRDYGGESATTDEQALVVGNEIYIPVLLGSLTSLSSMETQSIEISPLSQSYSRTSIKSVTITLDTDYPEVWEQLLAGTGTQGTATAKANDNFESGGWTGGNGWLNNWNHSGEAAVTDTGTPYQGIYHLRLRANTGYVDRAVDLSSAVSARLRFWAKVNSFEGTENAQALISPNGTNWTVVHTWTTADNDNTYHFYDIDLSSYTLTSQFWIAFKANMGQTNDNFYVDKLEIIYTHPTETTAEVDLDEGKIIITSTEVKQIKFPAGDMTADALYAGLVTFSTQSEPVTGTSIDTSQDYPGILDIRIDEGTNVQTQSTITVTVKNATAPFDIHADLSGLTNDPDKYDMFPDYTSPDSISATSWDVPNENTVRWTNIEHPAYITGNAVIVKFWVRNTENNMQFFTERVFLRNTAIAWY
jgi:FlaG/FlaF family flagellin (archaellin)